jgi:hypothetical protein
MKTIVVLWVIGLCGLQGMAQQVNALSEQDKKQGWALLFDGKTSNGLYPINSGRFSESGWSIRSSELCSNSLGVAESMNGIDLVTGGQYSNFELVWEWKMITPGGNSGVKYFVQDGSDNNAKHGVGLEYQILDDDNHPWMKEGKMKPGDYRTLGALYELYPCPKKHPRPLGEWNLSKIVCKGNYVQHWLNGEMILEYTRGSEDFRKRVAESKFKSIENFGEWERGRILLQHHGSEICFRNIKIKK